MRAIVVCIIGLRNVRLNRDSLAPLLANHARRVFSHRLVDVGDDDSGSLTTKQ